MSNSSGGKMTSRSKNTLRSYETEIEKCREESNWKKAVELAQQLKARSQQHESLAHFLIGEGKLEIYLSEWVPIKENQERAQRELSDARGYLTLATDEAGKKAGVALDAHLLLGKLNYACGAYEDTLKNYKMAELSSLTEKELPIRSLRIVAESFAIKGLCLEQTSIPGSSSKYKQAEKENEMITCYELASDLTLLYLQRGNPSSGVGPTLETALQRAPLLHIRAGRLTEAVDRYRNMLMAEESPSTQALRLTLTRLLAEVLMRGVTGQTYKPPEDVRRAASTLSRKKDDGQEGPWKPKKYCRMNQFVPTCIQEELALVLVIGEAMSARSAVLSQSAEFASLRERSLSVASTMADLLAVFAICARQHRLLIECLDRAMKFSFGCAHIWRQRALAYAAHCAITSLHSETANISSGPATPIVSALAVTKQAGTLCSKDAGLRLLTADLCYKGNWIEEGLELAIEALQIEQEESGPLLARCWLFVGIGYQMKAQKCNARIDKSTYNEKAQTHLLRSIELDDNDHLSFYHLALNYTYTGHLSEAMDCCRSALQRSSENSRALRLLLGGWSALSPRAPPPPLELLQHCAAGCPALPAQTALTIGVNLLQTLTQMEAEAEAYTDVDHLDALSDSQHDDTHSVRDAASIRAESAGVHRLERALSENASTIYNNVRKSPFSEQKAMAWLLVAEIYLRLDRVSTAAVCVSEAAALMPFSHQVLYTRGLVYAASTEWEEARQCFQNALSIHPTHIKSMVQLGSAYYHLGWLRLAEHWVRQALSLGGGRSSWQLLSMILSALQEHSAAADAAARALRTPADINYI